MKKIEYSKNIPTAPTGYNKGERVEWAISYTLTGAPTPRNNKNGAIEPDLLGHSIKTAKATINPRDCAKQYYFGLLDSKYFYEMDKTEFEIFLSKFSYIDYEHKSNDKHKKQRIKNDTKIMREWLEARAV
jgi:hypothetical protein